MVRVFISLLLIFVWSCSKSSDSEGLVSGEVVTDPDSITPVAPMLAPLSNQSLFEWLDNSSIINANDLSGGDLNSAGRPITYECFVDQVVDGEVLDDILCTSLSGLQFDAATGILSGTIEPGHGGVHEVKVKATADELSDELIFTLTVHTLDSLVLSLSSSEVLLTDSATATVTGFYSNGWMRPMTSLVSWTSSDESIATIADGNITTLSDGVMTLSADFQSFSSDAVLTVYDSLLTHVQINQISPTIPLNGSIALKATAFYDDGRSVDITSQANWTSDDTTVATVNGATGLVSAVSAGTTSIGIEFEGQTHQRTLQVTNFSVDSITLTPINPLGVIGLTTPIYATANLSNGNTIDITQSVEWISSQPTVATINAQGKVSSLSTGTTTITAQLGSISSQITFTVSSLTISSIAIESLNATMSIGFQQQARAVATLSNSSTMDVTQDVQWSSLNTTISSVQNSTPKGRVSSHAEGATTVRAQLGAHQANFALTVTNTSLSSINLSPSNTFLWQGEIKELKAIGVFSDASTLDITSQVTWSSSDTAKIIMSNAPDSKGYAQVVYVGTTTQNVTITATLGTVTRNMNAIINPATLNSLQINTTALTLAPNSLFGFKVFGHYSDGGNVDLTKSVTWTSTDTAVGFISNALNDKGSLFSEDAGVTVIQAQLGATQSNTVNVTVSELDPVEVIEVGTGLRASYFTGMNFNTLKGIRIDSVINYNWATGQAPLGVGDSFSIRWEGQLKSPVTASCRLHSFSDDGFRVYLDNSLVLNDWSNHSARWKNSDWINFTQDQLYDLRVEFYENSGFAVAQLHWECSGEFARTLIIKDYLFPAEID